MTVASRKVNIADPDKLAKIMQKILANEEENDRKKEHLWSIGVDAHTKIQYVELVALGTLNACLVHPREVFRLAIKKAVAAVFIAHNHPSGNAMPSAEDKAVTKRLKDAGNLIGIEVVDHLIITPRDYSSILH